ncbi:MAG: His/Gly/Thr/Pro-type tRNA ligase C-terminal domain-containing protein, partial [Clostridia bacterium]|nr:His/Gly/Thr/Pro-type tRNA ligase C-terminal domain-containing protein [Clostridia bacterium]
DARSEKIGKKIRDAQMEKVPYMLVLGDKEAEENVVAVRSRKTGETENMPLADFARKLCEEVRTKAR